MQQPDDPSASWTISDSHLWCLQWSASPLTTASALAVHHLKKLPHSPGAVIIIPVIEALCDLSDAMSARPATMQVYEETVRAILDEYKRHFKEIEDAGESRVFAVTNDFIVLTAALAQRLNDITAGERARSEMPPPEQASYGRLSSIAGSSSAAKSKKAAKKATNALNQQFQVVIRIHAKLPRSAIAEESIVLNSRPTASAADVTTGSALTSFVSRLFDCNDEAAYKINSRNPQMLASTGVPSIENNFDNAAVRWAPPAATDTIIYAVESESPSEDARLANIHLAYTSSTHADILDFGEPPLAVEASKKKSTMPMGRSLHKLLSKIFAPSARAEPALVEDSSSEDPITIGTSGITTVSNTRSDEEVVVVPFGALKSF
jgi:hypothetical protein